LAEASRNILLMGARGSGKTTVGRALSLRLDFPFVDLDDVVLARFEEASVTEVWKHRGEAAWRRAEAEMLESTLAETGQVVGLGGGTPMIEACASLIEAERAAGRVWTAYLACSAEVLAGRLRAARGDRPSLTGGDPADEIVTVVIARDATYRRLADFVCEGEGQVKATVETLVRMISPAA
jgi:shikimate kinase